MSTIAEQNAKQIRDAMEIYVGLSAVDSAATVSATATGYKIADTNISTSISNNTWSARPLADFAGDGFALDGSHVCYDSTAASLTYGKIGIRSAIGGSFTVSLTASRSIDAVTVFIDGSGTIANANDSSETYTARECVVVPVSGTAKTLTFTADTDSRIVLLKALPGIVMNFDNSNLISVTLGLRSCTAISDATWETSEIEIKAYWQDDITTAIGNLSDDVPITYKAGYGSDFSRTRYFYLSEPATMENNQITLKGEDASARLDNVTMPLTVQKNTRKTALQKMYIDFRDAIKKYAKITPRMVDAVPGTVGSSKKIDVLLFSASSAKDRVAEMMNMHYYSSSDASRVWWLSFVDAGYPCITWKRPTVSNCNRGRGIWTIKEEDCADVTRGVDRNVNKITSQDAEYGVETYCTIKSKATKFEDSKKVKAGTVYTTSFDGYVDPSTISISNGAKGTITVISKSADKVVWKSKITTGTYKTKVYYKDAKHKHKSPGNKKTKYYLTKTIKTKAVTVTAKSLVISDVHKSVAKNRPGTSIAVQPTTYGRQCNSNGSRLYPAYSALFQRSNETISFTWKGDPRIQPRDLIYFVPLTVINSAGTETTWDNLTAAEKSKYVYTVDDITLSHSGGGTSAEMSVRKGIC